MWAWTDSINYPSNGWADSGVIDLAIYHVFFLGAMADCTKICTVEGNAAVEMGAVERRIIHGELWKEELSMMSWHLMMEDDMSIT